MANIGIDFGTTNSLLVAYDRKLNRFHYFSYGDKGVPAPISSTVWYHDNGIVVGREARENMHKLDGEPGHHFEKSVKLKLENPSRKTDIFGNLTSYSDVAAEILRYIRNEAKYTHKAEKAGVDLNKAVFTVPINFSGIARSQLRKAAEKAGIRVTTFIHEPFAAIIGYYFSKFNSSAEKRLKELKEEKFLTVDWGGGTLDITVVDINDGKMQELGTAELTGLAGDKFDDDIANWVWTKFLDKIPAGKYTDEYLENCKKRRWGRLLSISERCKIELSSYEKSNFLLESVIPGDEDNYIDFEITRDNFTDLIASVLDKACLKIDEAISKADINAAQITSVLLTGGSCSIPAVQQRMTEKFGHRVKIVNNADLVIAQGAAVISEMGWVPFLTKDVLIELCDDSYWPIFERGMPIAADGSSIKSNVFTCVDQRNKNAIIIICDGILEKEQNYQVYGNKRSKGSTLAILNVPILADRRIRDDIVIRAKIDTDIILHIWAASKMVHGYDKDKENYSIRKEAKIHKLCFGLDIG